MKRLFVVNSVIALIAVFLVVGAVEAETLNLTWGWIASMVSMGMFILCSTLARRERSKYE